MPTTLDEKITKAKENIARLKHKRRVEKRREREAERKKNSRRHYIIGELVAKHFPEVHRFEPGTQTENAIEFKPLDTFLSVLTADQELIVRLKKEVKRRL